MPTAIAATPAGGDTIIKALDSIKAMDDMDKSKSSALKELPQDARSPFTMAEETPRDGSSSYDAQGSPEVAGNIHAWVVSPNKSGEVPSSKESSPDVSNHQTSFHSSKDTSPESFNLNITALSHDENKENVENSFSNANDRASPVSIVGKRLMEPNKSVVPPLGLAGVSSSNAAEGLKFEASKKDWIKIIHEGKEVMVMLHENVSVVVV